MNNYSFDKENNPLQLINCGSIDKYSYIIDLDSNVFFGSVNETFSFLVEYCILNKIYDYTILNEHLSKTNVIIGQVIQEDPKRLAELFGQSFDNNTAFAIEDSPFKVTEQKFNDYILLYLQTQDFLMRVRSK